MNINNIKSHLEEEGFRPSIDNDGDIVFKYEGGTYFIDIDAKDEFYVRIAYPNFWEIESEDERAKAIKCAYEATKLVKVAKISVEEDNVWGSVELFVKDDDAFASIFMRCLMALDGAVQEFISAMNKDAKGNQSVS